MYIYDRWPYFVVIVKLFPRRRNRHTVVIVFVWIIMRHEFDQIYRFANLMSNGTTSCPSNLVCVYLILRHRCYYFQTGRGFMHRVTSDVGYSDCFICVSYCFWTCCLRRRVNRWFGAMFWVDFCKIVGVAGSMMFHFFWGGDGFFFFWRCTVALVLHYIGLMIVGGVHDVKFVPWNKLVSFQRSMLSQCICVFVGDIHELLRSAEYRNIFEWACEILQHYQYCITLVQIVIGTIPLNNVFPLGGVGAGDLTGIYRYILFPFCFYLYLFVFVFTHTHIYI